MEPRVVIAVPLATPLIYWRTVAAILELEKTDATDLMVFQGALVDRARNHLVQQMLDHPLKPTHLLFIDADIIPPADTIPRLLAHRQPIVSGLYRKRLPPHEPMAFVKTGRGMNGWLGSGARPHGQFGVRLGGTRDRTRSLRRVDYVGAGCLLIHRKVFEKIRPPWFQIVSTPRKHLSEDFAFCEQAQRAGFKIYVDTSVRPLHLEPIGIGTDPEGKVSFIPLL